MNGMAADAIDLWTRTFLTWLDRDPLGTASGVSRLLERLENDIRAGRILAVDDDPRCPSVTPKNRHSLTADTFLRAYENVVIELGKRSNSRSRRQSGVYFTPASLVRVIGEHGVSAALAHRTGTAEASGAGRLCEAFRVCDPACGAGDFLLDAGRRIAQAFAPGNPRESDELAMRRQVTKHGLFGVDIDANHVRATQLALWIWSGASKESLTDAVPNIVCADALAENCDGVLEVTRRWPEGFDVVVGNPPFANAIEEELNQAMKPMKRKRRRLFGELAGTADAAYYFVALADRIARPNGAIGMVTPRAFLSAPAARRLRERLLLTRPPAVIYAPPNPFLFAGANVFVAALVLRKGSQCVASREKRDDRQEPPMRPIVLDGDNWWAPLTAVRSDIGEGNAGLPAGGAGRLLFRLGERFDVFASMTTSMAYELALYLVDEQGMLVDVQDQTMRLVTTGLIEPGECRWGRQVCRYLGKRYRRPVVPLRGDLPRVLHCRLEKVRRPKLLVAGLCARLEAFLDGAGSYCGAVSTWTIVHPENDVAALEDLCRYLNGDAASSEFQKQLGATALGGGRITVTKDFLRKVAVVY